MLGSLLGFANKCHVGSRAGCQFGCTITLGSRTCGDCPKGFTSDGANGCKEEEVECEAGTVKIPGMDVCIDKAGQIGLSGHCSETHTCTIRQQECQDAGGDFWCVNTTDRRHKSHANASMQTVLAIDPPL